MSGLEILGVAASAVQVAQVSLAIVTSLTSLFNQIHDASKIVQTRLVQVQTLAEISRLIASMPQLQTAEVEIILQSCLKEAEELKDVLQGLFAEKDGPLIKKWTKAVGGVVMEKRIAALLHSLEVGKSALTLCIIRIDSTLLYEIDSRLDIMRQDLERVALNVNDELPRLRTAIEYLTYQYKEPAKKDSSMSEKTDICLRSLGAINQSPFISQMLNRSKQAGEWILKNQKYVSWLENNEADLLWITAKAGCGKTTLASHITLRVQANTPSQSSSSKNNGLRPVILFFFFHRSNSEAEGTATGALRTIVSQIAHQVPSVLPIVLERYELLSSRGNFEWSWENLLSMIGDIFECMQIDSRVYIILDALDECEPKSRRLLLDWLQDLVDNSKPSVIPKTSRPLLKFFVTNRPDGSIFDSLSQFPNIEITASDTAADMHTLINNRIRDFSRCRHLDNDASQKIIEFLEENAHGMFLWVVLIIQDLERRDERLTEELITAKLSSIPLTLIKAYETILRSPLPTRKMDMWRMFRWLLFARRGLTLAELEVALCLEAGVTRWYDFAGDVYFLCGSLIRSDGPRGEINFVHQTARDFLEAYVRTTGPEDVAGISMNVIAANAHLAEICVQYLVKNEYLSDLRRCHISGNRSSYYKSTMGGFLRHHPFLCYAIGAWASHLRAVDTPSTKLHELVLLLLASEERRDNIMQLTYFINNQGSSAMPIHQQPIHLAAYFNLAWLVKFYISQNKKVIHAISTDNDTPLIWASEMGSIACVKLLLDAGADPNKFEYDGWSALHWAARNGHVEIVKMLVDHGASLYQQDGWGHTPLEWAADREHWVIVDFLKGRVDKEEAAKLVDIMAKRFPRRSTKAAQGSVKVGQLWDWRP